MKKVEKDIRNEHEQQGHNGLRTGAPSCLRRLVIILAALALKNAARPTRRKPPRHCLKWFSALYWGGGSGESDIRRHVLDGDLVEAIIALPTDMFYNTGIATYIWILSNRKPPHRKGLVQLVDASSFWQKMRKSLGSKRKELSEEHIREIVKIFGEASESELATVFDAQGKEQQRATLRPGDTVPTPPPGGTVKRAPLSRLFKNSEFGYQTITIERPARDEAGKVIVVQKGKAKGKPQPDADLRDTENVPLGEDVTAYFKREVLPHARTPG